MYIQNLDEYKTCKGNIKSLKSRIEESLEDNEVQNTLIPGYISHIDASKANLTELDNKINERNKDLNERLNLIDSEIKDYNQKMALKKKAESEM